MTLVTNIKEAAVVEQHWNWTDSMVSGPTSRRFSDGGIDDVSRTQSHTVGTPSTDQSKWFS